VADATKDLSAQQQQQQQQQQKDAAGNEGDAASKTEQEGEAIPLSAADAAKEAGNKAFSELIHPPSLKPPLFPCFHLFLLHPITALLSISLPLPLPCAAVSEEPCLLLDPDPLLPTCPQPHNLIPA